MKVEKPCSPGHCLSMLNDNMRTDILRSVHQHIESKKDQQDKESPLVILISSIGEALRVFEKHNLFESIGPNPFNIKRDYRFNSELDYLHDIKLLKTQLKYLKKTLADLERYA